jgi:hypothetical protein
MEERCVRPTCYDAVEKNSRAMFDAMEFWVLIGKNCEFRVGDKGVYLV